MFEAAVQLRRDLLMFEAAVQLRQHLLIFEATVLLRQHLLITEATFNNNMFDVGFQVIAVFKKTTPSREGLHKQAKAMQIK